MGNLFPFSLSWKDYLPFGLNNSSSSANRELSDIVRLRDGTAVTLRAVRLDDGERIQDLVRGLSLDSRYQRFFHPLHELSPDMLARFLQDDPTGAITLLATVQQGGEETAIAMAQYVCDPYPVRGEFAVVVADAWQRGGLATRLIQTLICVARAAGIAILQGDVLADNEAMVRLMVNMGFVLDDSEDGAYLLKASKVLEAPDWKCSPLVVLASEAKRKVEGRVGV
ncbi:GNAT family N-acetyltransferase [Noviherbaspirillum sp. CPCC 100848]|uniref:GNAT family N-acetyltransferase n=1 Tax=Noviherbaspirillum album TaxID=3080276 RepID=A0ABU6J494_9BURK|nr:GNAT family N-acetyltransferase [Noviherbaspirillum sp. CPCC 100848]MEC4718456.1 GNAT family N-acetyltransferase [Noviherbaspirillum sp. CPCC 100848]